MNWVRSYDHGIEYLEHLDGVDWFEAPTPPRSHRCSAQSRGWMAGSYVERCACGAIRLGRFDPWMERNQRSGGELTTPKPWLLSHWLPRLVLIVAIGGLTGPVAEQIVGSLWWLSIPIACALGWVTSGWIFANARWRR